MRRWMARAGLVGAGVGVLGLTACAPRFPDGASLTFDRRAAAITVSWPHAVELDDGQVVAAYDVTIDGGAPISIEPGRNGCNLVGLATGTHAIAVTARDDAGEVSGKVIGSIDVVAPGLPGPSGSNCQTGPEAPGAPTAVVAQPVSAGTASLTWAAPNFQGSPTDPVAIYRIVPHRDGVPQAEVWASATAPLTTSIGGLTSGASYTFTVEALNSFGIGPASLASAPIAIS